MGLTLDIADGKIDEGDDKDITLVGEDPSGNAVTLSSIDLEIMPDNGSDTTYNINDFSVSGNEYSLEHRFDNPGFVNIKATVQDMGGTQEVTKDDVIVNA